MKEIVFSSKYFNIADTLNCGQVFRFSLYKDGYICYSIDKACYVYTKKDKTIILCNDEDENYFYNYFDLVTNYENYVNFAIQFGGILEKSATLSRGIRILKQDKAESLFSFIISQNNNIPRIKKTIELLCEKLGERREFLGENYYTFPTAKTLSSQSVDFFKGIGLGYRAPYIKKLADDISGNILSIENLSSLSTTDLQKNLKNIYGVGQKVADCVSLFGFHRFDVFPVDTWIEKVYRENFLGKETNREKITAFFVGKFKNNSGIFQQYLFYYKRSLENVENPN